MAFLDNSGDIILDAVLTDLGRERLAKGDGSFRITKFALADDEINYGLYDSGNLSGSAYYDLQILQSPILEAFTNNASSVKSKLLSIARKDLLYLPVIQLYLSGQWARFATANAHVVEVDQDTVDAIHGTAASFAAVDGVLNGYIVADSDNSIRADQGLDTTQVSPTLGLDPDLVETQYLVEMDSRLGSIWTPGGNNANATAASVSFIDDDQIATYYFTSQTDSDYITSIPNSTQAATSILGPRGTSIRFRLMASTALRTNDYFFTTLGSAGTIAIGSMAAGTYRFIDTIISITGVTTGYRIDIPVRLVKKNS